MNDEKIKELIKEAETHLTDCPIRDLFTIVGDIVERLEKLEKDIFNLQYPPNLTYHYTITYPPNPIPLCPYLTNNCWTCPFNVGTAGCGYRKE